MAHGMIYQPELLRLCAYKQEMQPLVCMRTAVASRTGRAVDAGVGGHDPLEGGLR